MQQQSCDMSVLCVCGARRGLHRHGDDACPNRYWRAGNGESQWRDQRFQPVARWQAPLSRPTFRSHP